MLYKYVGYNYSTDGICQEKIYFSYSAMSPMSGITHNSTAFVGCDNKKVRFCFRTKNLRYFLLLIFNHLFMTLSYSSIRCSVVISYFHLLF